MTEEQQQVRLAKQGDQQAFAWLVTAYEKKIYNLALRYLGDREDACDATQEVFLRVFRFLSGFQEESGFSTWIYRVGVNVCKDMLARRSRRNEQSLSQQDDEEKDYTLEIADDSYDPELLLQKEELKQTLADAISALPEQYRAILVLRDIEGLRYDEIGTVLQLEDGTVKSRIARAREKLRKKLLQKGNIRCYSGSNLAKGGKTDEIL